MDNTLKIYHLGPNILQDNSSTDKGSYALMRSDFFAVKNYVSTNEAHKNEIDRFVVDYLRMDEFLTEQKNAEWSLTFFRYGDGIDENTAHVYDTDYAIHDLFAQKKEIGLFTFDTRLGYRESSYWIDFNNFNYDPARRPIVAEYFALINKAN